jgi:hypothetical protein
MATVYRKAEAKIFPLHGVYAPRTLIGSPKRAIGTLEKYFQSSRKWMNCGTQVSWKNIGNVPKA